MKKLSLILVLFFCALGTMLAQRTITGTITDNTGEALIGASVVVKGAEGVGTTSDIDGSYSLNVPAGSDVLIYSYTGYGTLEETLGASNVLNITLEEGVAISEVIVTAVGLEANKRTIGYAVQNVDPDEVLGAKETNFVDALNSKVAGVQVTSSSGSPGASSNIVIRGSKSITGSNNPLFVVDGVPISNDEIGNGTAGVDQSNRAIDINPNDIASITVLKGPSATALYGVRAANGAVVITTKKGVSGKPVVNITASYSADQVNKLPERQSTYAQGNFTGGVPIWRGPNTFEGGSWGPRISELEFDGSDYPYDSRGRLVPKGTGNGTPAEAYDPYDFFVTGQTYDLGASVSGGTDNVRYYISGGRLTSQGVIPTSEFSRTSFRVNLDTDITDKFSASMSANFVNSGGNRLQRGSNLRGVMLGLLRNTPTFDIGNGKKGQDAVDDPSSYLLPNGDQRSYRAGVYDSPYWVVNKNASQDNVNRIIGNTGLRYEFTDWLAISYKLGIDHYTDRRNGAVDIVPNWSPGEVSQSTISNTDINSDLLLTFNNKLSDDFSLSATGGFNVFDTKYVNQEVIGSTLSASNFYHISNATDLVAGEAISGRRLYGLFVTTDLNYADFAFLNLTVRNDWSSTLPSDNNTFQSYSASLGLDLTEAFKIPRNDILSYAKVRASYGAVGNDAPIYATSNYFESALTGGDGFISVNSFPAYGVNAFERDVQLGNDKIVPETTTTFEVGAELKLWKGRLGFDITYFNSESKDQIIPVDLSATTGFTTVIQNAGIISNKGWEISADLDVLTVGDFNWTIGANFTRIRSKVEELAEGIDNIFLAGFTSTSVAIVPDQPFSVLFGDGFQRDANDNVLIGSNGWPLADPTKKVLGDPNPDYTLGLRNGFSYKGISISALLDIRQGGDVWCGTCGIMNDFGTSKLSADERDDVVIFDGVLADGTPNNIPVALADPTIGGYSNTYRKRYGFGGISEMSIFDASWVRLREVSVGYSVPKSVFENTFIGGLRVTLTGRNLWLNTDYPGIDPETNLTGASNGYGLEYFNNPNTKSFAATVKLTF